MLKQYIKQSPIVYGLILANVVCFVMISLLPNHADRVHHLALWLPINPHYQPIQWVTSIFTHQNLWHLFFNMYALWFFGIAVYRRLGTMRFLGLYMMSALSGSALHLLFSYQQLQQDIKQLLLYADQEQINQQLWHGTLYVPTSAQEIALKTLNDYSQNIIGASGAIFGVLVAFAYLYANVPLKVFLIPKPIKAKYLIGLMVLYEMIAQIVGYSILTIHIAHLAHIGGAIMAYVLMFIFYPSIQWKKLK